LKNGIRLPAFLEDFLVCFVWASSAAERRKNAAHGVSRGSEIEMRTSPGGAKDQFSRKLFSR
jgi:hypothetical protein